MIREWIVTKLQDRLAKEKHNVIKLQWEKVRLERLLEQAAAAGSKKEDNQ